MEWNYRFLVCEEKTFVDHEFRLDSLRPYNKP